MAKNPNYSGNKDAFILLEDVCLLTRCGLLNKTPLIVDKNNQIIKETLDEQLFWSRPMIHTYSGISSEERIELINSRINNFQAYANNAPKKRQLVIPKEQQAIYLCHSHGTYQFGHFHDSMQRLWNLPPSLLSNSKFVVSDTRKIKDFDLHLSALTEKEITESDLISTRLHDAIFFDRLVYPRCPVYPASYTPESIKWVRQRYHNYFRESNAISDVKKVRLYLSRNHVRPGSRGVINEDSLLKTLVKDCNFIVLKGDEKLETIIKLFRNASVIVGPHGSLFANTIYTNSDCKIIEWCPSNRIDYSFRNKPKLTKDYIHKLVPADKDFNIEVSDKMIDEIKLFL